MDTLQDPTLYYLGTLDLGATRRFLANCINQEPPKRSRQNKASETNADVAARYPAAPNTTNSRL